MGQNRKKCKSEKDANSSENLSSITQLFQSYQVELDAKYDKYERLMKKSRDLTIESKRIIFLLHRITSSGNNDAVLQEAESRLATLLLTVINDIALELNKREVYQYIRAFTAGLQEFVEAMSFYHYLRNGNLICIEEIYNPVFIQEPPEELSESTDLKGEASTKADLPLSTLLSPVDYVLGVADLTGELMRKCINSVAMGDIDEPFKLCVLLQNIYQAFLICNSHSRDMNRKLYTLRCSLKKVENACYAIKIRGTETPKHMLADFFSADDSFNMPADCDI